MMLASVQSAFKDRFRGIYEELSPFNGCSVAINGRLQQHPVCQISNYDLILMSGCSHGSIVRAVKNDVNDFEFLTLEFIEVSIL